MVATGWYRQYQLRPDAATEVEKWLGSPWKHGIAATALRSGGQAGVNIDSFNDAQLAAVPARISFYAISGKFGDFVTRTCAGIRRRKNANPCVTCNTHIKWRALLARAGAPDVIYCNGSLRPGETAYQRQASSSGEDLAPTKHQSYALGDCSRICWVAPAIETYRKPRSQMAHDFGYPNCQKERSEICFVPDNDYRGASWNAGLKDSDKG